MRSNLGTHFAGNGMEEGNYNKDDHYKNKKEYDVRFTNDYVGKSTEEFDTMCERLSGKVTTYFIKV